MGDLFVLGIDVVAALLTLAYITKLLFEASEQAIRDGYGSLRESMIKRSLRGQHVCPRMR